MSAVIVLILRVILSMLLFAIVGYTLYLLWKDIKDTQHALSSQVVRPIYLHLDPDLNESAKKYTDDEILIGRDPACNFTITDTAISARHARLYFKHNQWWLEDLGSTNGTFLNLEPLEAPVILVDGDQIKIGTHHIHLSIMQIAD